MKIIKFYTKFCPVCTFFDETYNKIKEEYKDKVEFIECEQTINKDMFDKYIINKVPTLIYFKGNEEIIRHIKPEQYEIIKTFIEKNLLVKEEEEC
jgi:thiol-disulfide isomerase/thioredoxin